MKKLLAILLAVVCLATMSVVAFASNTLTERNAQITTEFTYSVAEHYEITIPSTLNINAALANPDTGDVAGLRISADNVTLGENRILEVRATSANNFVLKNAAAESQSALKGGLPYDFMVKAGNADGTGALSKISENGGLVLTLDWRYPGVSYEMSVRNLDLSKAFVAGEYTDTLTFTATVRDIAQS